jgi:hypothetical protein
MSTRLLIAMMCLAMSLGCYQPHTERSGLPNALWYFDDAGFWMESRGGQVEARLVCGEHRKKVASMHSLGPDWIIRVYAYEVNPESWKLGIQPYSTSLEAERAAERYVDYYKLCPSS